MEMLIGFGLLFIVALGYVCACWAGRFIGENYRPRWGERRIRPSGAVIFLTHGPVQK